MGFRTRGGIARGLRHCVPQTGDIVGKVGRFAGAARRVVLAQADSWSDGHFGEGRAQTWMAVVLDTSWRKRSRRLGELCAFVGEFLCHGELNDQAQRRPNEGDMPEEENDMKYVQEEEAA